MPFGSFLSRRQERGINGDPLLSVSQERGVIPQEEAGRRNIASADKSTYWRVYPGDIVYNTMRIWQGASSYSEFFGIVSPAYTVCQPADGVSSRYLAYLLKHPDSVRRFEARSQGITSDVWNLRYSEFARIQVDFIAQELHRNHIADILSTVDEAIEQTEALIAKYQQIKAGLMHDLFTRGLSPEASAKGDVTWTLRPTRSEAPHLYKESPIGWIPKEWEIVPVEDLCSDIVDCPHSTPTYVQGGIPCIRTADMQPGELLLEQVYRVTEEEYGERVARLVPQKGDVIYSREGERLGIASPVGKERVCLGQRVMLLRPSSITDPDFLVWAMNTPVFYRRIVAGLGATTSPHVNVGDIRKAMLSRPSSAEQMMIGKLLARQTILLSAEEFQLSKLRQVKHGLMHDLLTGRVRVKVSGVATTSAR